MKMLSKAEFAEFVDALPNTAPAASRLLIQPAEMSSGSLHELQSMLPFLPIDDGRGNGSIDVDGADNWLGVTWALCREYGDDARETWREQCKLSSRYDEQGFEKDWDAYDPGHPKPITIKSVYPLARQRGWERPTPQPSIGRFKLLNGAAINALPPLEWCVKGYLPCKGLGAIFGPSASGKSFLAIDLGLAIAEGKYWFGNRVKARTVVYVTLEGEAGLQNRLKAWQEKTGKELPHNFFAIAEPLDLREPQDVSDLITALPQGCVVFIDTLNRAAPGADENSSIDMGLIISALKRIVEEADALVIPIHHTGKDANKGLRGHSSLFAALDGAIEVERRDNVRSFRAAKVKDGNDGDKTGFCLKVVALGFDGDGDAITSCVVVADDLVVQRRVPKGEKQRSVIAAIKDAGPVTLEDAITIAGPIVSQEKNRQRNTATRMIDTLKKGGFLQLSGPDDLVSVP